MKLRRLLAIALVAATLSLSTFAVFDLISLDRAGVDWGWFADALGKNVTGRTSMVLIAWVAMLAVGGLLIVHLAGWGKPLRKRPKLALALGAAAISAGVALYRWANEPQGLHDSTGRTCTLMYLPPDCAIGRPPLDLVDSLIAMAAVFGVAFATLALIAALAARFDRHSPTRVS